MSRNRNPELSAGLGIFTCVLIFLVGITLFRGLEISIDLNHRLEGPSTEYVLGTDDLGRDMLSAVVCGAWISLATGGSVAGISILIGGLLGFISGLSGGFVDTIIMRIVDIVLAFPGILLVILLMCKGGGGMVKLIMAMVFYSWAGYARIIRSEVLKYREKEFILAAKSYNASYFRIVVHHLMPLLRPHLVVGACTGMSNAILVESSLNFLGLGLAADVPTLGQLIDMGRGHMFDRPELICFPGLVLFLIILAVNLVGEGIRFELVHPNSFEAEEIYGLH